jgi:hypothetical protein
MFSPQALLWQNFKNLCAVAGLWITIWKTSEPKKSVIFAPLFPLPPAIGVLAKVSLLLLLLASSSPFEVAFLLLALSLSPRPDIVP